MMRKLSRASISNYSWRLRHRLCDLQQNYSDDLRCRGGRGESAKREGWSREPLSENGSRLKTSEDSVIYHGKLPAGMERGKGYNPPDRLIAD